MFCATLLAGVIGHWGMSVAGAPDAVPAVRTPPVPFRRVQTGPRVSPDVVPASAADVRITFTRGGADTVRQVRLTGCDRDTAVVRVTRRAAPEIRIPARVLLRPCVLRVRFGDAGFEVPLAAADPALFRLARVPAFDSEVYHPWGGIFNSTVCATAPRKFPERHAIVSILADSAITEPFVLGKRDRVVMRLVTLAPDEPFEPPNGCWGLLLLPGVEADDVRWDDLDIEAFWIGTLAADGRTVHHRQPLSGMVTEPSGPLDTGTVARAARRPR